MEDESKYSGQFDLEGPYQGREILTFDISAQQKKVNTKVVENY